MASANEFPRPIPTDSLPEGGATFDVAATPEERHALARRLDLVGLEALSARGRVERLPAGGTLVRVSGTLEAAVVQECVVTLEPLASAVRAPLERLYGDAPVAVAAATSDGAAGELVVDPEGEDIEPLPGGGVIDVGEAVVEELALTLDPYPRAPDALERVADLLDRPDISLNAREDSRERPFAAALRRRRAN